MEFEKIADEPLRPEVDPAYDKELWRPTWRCFCCHDTGFILPRLAEKIIEGYQPRKSKFPLCTASNCKVNIGDNKQLLASINYRVPVELCDRLDRLERKGWWEWQKQDLANKTIDISSIGKSLRSPRTSSEQMYAEQNHQNVLDEINSN